MTLYVSVCRIDRTSEGKKLARFVEERFLDRYVGRAFDWNPAVNFMLIANLNATRTLEK